MIPGIYKYQRVDVFTDRPFCGNPMAVFTDAQGLDEVTMQRIARELHLSETSFVFPSASDASDYAVRVFTPSAEIRTDGSPTLGTVFALGRAAKLRDVSRVVLHGNSGPVSVTLVSPMTTMRHPIPEFGDKYEDVDAAAALLCLTRRDILLPSPVQAVHCGLPFTLIPIADRDALQRIQFRTDIWRRTIANTPAPNIVAFTPNVREPHASRVRVFAPGIGVLEDAATPTAIGCVAAYLVRHSLIRCSEDEHLIFSQGIEMGRPSEIHATLKVAGKQLLSLRVGGECVWTGQGEIHVLPPPNNKAPPSSRP